MPLNIQPKESFSSDEMKTFIRHTLPNIVPISQDTFLNKIVATLDKNNSYISRNQNLQRYYVIALLEYNPMHNAASVSQNLRQYRLKITSWELPEFKNRTKKFLEKYQSNLILIPISDQGHAAMLRHTEWQFNSAGFLTTPYGYQPYLNICRQSNLLNEILATNTDVSRASYVDQNLPLTSQWLALHIPKPVDYDIFNNIYLAVKLIQLSYQY